MKLAFSKMSGAGNDFVVIDNRDAALNLSNDQIAKLCDRHFGIGADGLLAVELTPDADFRMRYYNADGGEAEMCGNGARCFARFVEPLRSHNGNLVTFTTPAGLIRGEYVGSDVAVNLTSPTGLAIGQKLTLPTAGEPELLVHSLNTGVPHAVVFVEDVEKTPIVEWGRALRRHTAFAPRGTNANFAQILDGSTIRVRTYERGVEDETLACGTGVTAAAILAHVVHGVSLPVRVKVQGGDFLAVRFKSDADKFSDVTLQGPATVVFKGEIEI
ncbi:MAG: diaminopimelate epimerase [Candidatus Methylacidiphilales bacterium]|nr:diaminopimelate epimerase [Candidatus Methylacidiphilales bacterium]